ncbi:MULTISPECIES: threonine/serine exporter family protein [Apilactobacillus]|uniref:Threonine/serine exporter family protein n=1 Tax=Apilactobacillus waqarii TaxID=2851006 RepID=A0ABS6M3Z4_9LACO|nr:threonine/serine exporter family protein [Apilactobacillus kunkeei]MBI0091154.1 threonine/serine exporter family protein [Lactobacillus sp. M0345]MBV0914894.1 threonine/serine exporter family protein [Apilactobacillus waqarii]MBX8455910.1 threonine/serine exporter family protein [Apilactobacillus kunkeei]QYU54095.1 threonine/serine exporter family protein [Apilactobacillus kunkeei]
MRWLNERQRSKLVVETCLLAGKIMIENGSEMVRVTDTIDRISRNAGATEARAYVTLTGIIMSATPDMGSQVTAIDKRTFDLEKVSTVNDYSRQFADKKISLGEFYRRLKRMDKDVKPFPFWLQMIGAFMVSATLEVVFRSNYTDFWAAGFVGMMGWCIYCLTDHYTDIRFLNEFIAAICIGFMSILIIRAGIAKSADDLIIGGLMPLVPGVPITNAVRDTLSGNLVSGPSRGIEAIMSACALGFGVAMAIKILG